MLEAIFKNSSQQILLKYKTQLDQINALEDNLKLFTDLELKDQTNKLKIRLRNGATKSSILPEAFALVREASRRVLGLRHFDVQLIGGIVLTEGKIAEMKTGEGKTLVALLPSFLNALYEKGTHVVTVNDYLARRDAESVGQVHRFLGLTVGLIQENMEPAERKKNYNCDVVYVTNNELGFDYLRDNMAFSAEEIVQRPFFYCVVDEVDSILIDEARTPLIISGAGKTSTDKYLQTTKLVKILKRDIHYNVDEKTQNVTLTNEGVSFCEQALGIVDLYSPYEPWVFFILNSIKAKELFQRNKNYIVNENDEIIIVDEFTGRTMAGRRWSDGLHQAIEAKENLPIQDESQTLASISYQNLFLLYEQLSGMTGTAKTEEGEFEKIYNLSVVQIPTNRDIKRKDLSDLIYKNQYIKWRCIAQECLDMYNIGRPVLIGTTTIEKSELLAALLSEYKVPYRLLNARPENVESESEIVSQAGCKNAITIATNMAGRGTDILLGGNATFLTADVIKDIFDKKNVFENNPLIASLTQNEKALMENLKGNNYQKLLKQPLSELENKTDPEIVLFLKLYNSILKEQEQLVKQARDAIINLGGLHVIGTERHESRRIDNQLRGRSGRQGDPGSSRFFLCLEDKLLRIFGGDQILNVMQNIGFQDDTPIQSGLLNKSLESAQKKVESFYFDTRKQLFEYDQALNIQRNSVYSERRRIFEKTSVRDWLVDYAARSLDDLLNRFKIVDDYTTINFITLKLQNLLGGPFPVNFNETDQPQYLSFLQQQIEITYDLKEVEMELIEVGLFRELEKSFILQQIDNAWTEHLQKIAFLRDSIRWIAYGQKDPLTEYKKEAFNYFNIMLARIRHRVVYFVLRAKTILI
jgi:preprotein translocase subunit SecA|tara:strand:+ start:9567 stop:12170 length:2604 start_codon:yes stop_codon:yes gene_type:complete